MNEHAHKKEWWPYATGCTLEHFPTRREALDREASLIQVFRPPYNQQHNPEIHLATDERSTRLDSRALQALPEFTALLDRPLGTEFAWPTTVEEYLALPSQVRRISPCVDCGGRPGWPNARCVACREKKSMGILGQIQTMRAKCSATLVVTESDVDNLQRDIDELAETMTREHGKVLASDARKLAAFDAILSEWRNRLVTGTPFYRKQLRCPAFRPVGTKSAANSSEAPT